MLNINTTENFSQEKKSPCFTGLTGPEAIRLILSQRGIRQEDIAPIIGSSGATSEILSGKRTISKPIARRLNRWLGIPVHVLRRCGA